MRRWSVSTVGLIVIGLALTRGAAFGQSQDPASRLKTASDQMSLLQVDGQPWHMKVDVTTFDGPGADPSQGTIEVWNAGKDRKVTTTFGNAVTVSLLRGGRRYWTGTNEAEVPSSVDVVLEEILNAGPDDQDIRESKPEQRKQKFGKVSLDRIMLTQPIKTDVQIPLGLFPTYCLDSENHIRSSYDLGNQTVLLNGIGKFLDHLVPTQVDVYEGEVKTASAKVAILSTYLPQADEFNPGREAREVGNVTKVAGSVIAGSRITFVQPIHPQRAKVSHESGMVVLRAMIGRNGKIQSLRPVSATNADFAISAIAAVRFWTYKPYLLNGEPTAVDTTVTVKY